MAVEGGTAWTELRCVDEQGNAERVGTTDWLKPDEVPTVDRAYWRSLGYRDMEHVAHPMQGRSIAMEVPGVCPPE